MTHPEIAQALGISRTRVQQIEAVALAKLRAAFGSDATGPAGDYLAEWEGVPEPGDEGGAAASRRSRRRRGVGSGHSRGRVKKSTCATGGCLGRADSGSAR